MKSKKRLLRNNTMVVKVYGPAYASPKHVLRWRRKLSLRLYLIPIDLFKGEHNDPEFLELQSFGVLPLIQDGDYTLYESQAIMRHYAECTCHKGLICWERQLKKVSC